MDTTIHEAGENFESERDIAAANKLLSLLVDCLNVQRDHGITPGAERFAYAALAAFIRQSP